MNPTPIQSGHQIVPPDVLAARVTTATGNHLVIPLHDEGSGYWDGPVKWFNRSMDFDSALRDARSAALHDTTTGYGVFAAKDGAFWVAALAAPEGKGADLSLPLAGATAASWTRFSESFVGASDGKVDFDLRQLPVTRN